MVTKLDLAKLVWIVFSSLNFKCRLPGSNPGPCGFEKQLASGRLTGQITSKSTFVLVHFFGPIYSEKLLILVVKLTPQKTGPNRPFRKQLASGRPISVKVNVCFSSLFGPIYDVKLSILVVNLTTPKNGTKSTI